MANYDVFNPSIPDITPPDWTRVSQPISQPEADKSKGILLAGAGETITDTARLGENIEENYLKEKVHAGVDALRDTTTAAYESIRRAQIAGVPPDPRAVKTAGFTGTLAGNNTPELPEALQAGLDKATTLALAKSQGRGNDTLYTGALNALSKQLRQEYPGHVDFIDEQIARISGKNPANAYMDNLLTDINRAGTGQDVFQKMLVQKVSENYGNPEVQKWWLALQHGIPNAMGGLTNAVMGAERIKAQNEQWKAIQAMTKADLEADKTVAETQYEIRAQQTMAQHMNPVLDVPQLSSPQTVQRLIEDSLSGSGVVLTAKQHNDLLSNMTAARSQAAADLQKVADQEGYSSRMRDPGKVDAIMNRQLAYIDRTIDMLKNKDYGSLFEAKRTVEAMQSDTAKQMATNRDLGEWLRMSKVLQDNVGPQWTNYIDALGLRAGKLQQLQSFFSDSMKRASLPDDLRQDGNVKSLYNDLQAARQAKSQGAKAPDAIYDNLVDNVNLILKAKEQGNENVAKEVTKYTFDPTKNSKIMEFFGRDYTDTNGVFHKGRFAVYDNLTKTPITDAIWDQKDKQTWGMYKDWQETSFRTLFGEEAKNLTSIQSDKSTPFKLKWDADNHRMDVEFGVKPQTTVDTNYQDYVKRSVNALNSGLNNLSYMYGKEKIDVNAKLFEMIMGMGYSPTSKLEGDLPQRVINAIAASNKPKPSIEEVGKAIP